MCMVALGVIQQYYIYLKTAIFFNKKVVTLLYLWLAAALAAWYNECFFILQNAWKSSVYADNRKLGI